MVDAISLPLQVDAVGRLFERGTARVLGFADSASWS